MSTPAITTPAVPLPGHPVLLSGLDVLERGPGEIQIGLDPRHGVVITGLPGTLVDRLRRLDGRQTADAILLAESEHREQLRTVLTQLTALGLVTEAEPASHSPRRGVETGLWSLRARHHQTALTERRRTSAMAVLGDGRLAVAVAVLLANAGIGHLDIRMSGTVTEQDLGSGFTETELGMPRRSALADVVRRADPRTRTTRLTCRRGPELVLLTDAVVPAPEVVDELMTAGTPHLPVRVRDGTGIVGPLVVPGRTSCLRCADLHRTDLEPCWPRIASQLAGRDQHPDLGAVQCTAALAVAQAMRLLSPSETPPPVWNATLEIDAFDGKVRRRTWVPHPRCPCGAVAVRQPA
ncbi:TOMM precursor leader peptide-binding protein [Amycolatopsis samaneae]|uniref:TOMM leader peptide-binding protein n=1 Tax=Amycolatopsis samaneae TaxID=664691 RepID=A0ABW5GML8_9PSEU